VAKLQKAKMAAYQKIARGREKMGRNKKGGKESVRTEEALKD
jgi:hypothetical protein